MVPIWSVIAKRAGKVRSAKGKTHSQPPSARSGGFGFAPHVHDDIAKSLHSGIGGGHEQVVSVPDIHISEQSNQSNQSNQSQQSQPEKDLAEIDQIPVSLRFTGHYLTVPQVIVFPLHQDYLITQSRLFRLLLSSAQPSEMTSSPRAPGLPAPLRTAVLDGDPEPTNPLRDGALKGARMLPVPEGEPPMVYLPLPDSGAFAAIVHYLYW